MYSTGSIVFFNLSFGLSVRQIALALSAAGVAAFLAALPAGYLADRWGPRPMAVGLTVAQALLLCPMLFSDSHSVVVPLVVALGAADRANSVARRTLVSHVIGEADRVRTQAYLRSVANTAMSIGALAVAPLLAVGTHTAFVVLVTITMAAYLVVAVTTTVLPTRPRTSPVRSGAASGDALDPEREPRPERRRLAAFTLLGLLNGTFALHISLLEVGLPLWVTEHTDAPAWTVATLVFVNTVLAILLQVAASRGSSSVRGAARALIMSAVLTASACAVFAMTSGRTGPLLVAALLVATVVLTLGEILQSAGEWGLSFGLAPANAEGRYIGAFTVGTTVQDMVGPALVGGVVIAYAPEGWFVLAAVFLVGAVLVAPMTNWVAGLHGDREDVAAEHSEGTSRTPAPSERSRS